MKNGLSFLAVVVLGAASACAQEGPLPVTLGFKVGVPVTEMLNANNTSFLSSSLRGPYNAGVPRYEFGVSGEFHLPYHLRFEVDGLYKRGGFGSTLPLGSGFSNNSTKFNVWEVPGLLKYNVSLGHFRPFLDVGASLRHISTIGTSTYEPGFAFASLRDNAGELRNRNSYGGVAGFGITFKKGPFELTPEARYTRWANKSFSASGLKSAMDQGDVLLGIGF